ncbi:PEP/pyruvate-binding domain-containing protein [Glutamicibacter protophormiae]|uniref:PEP/pyruvate-binding domain-containing protein n=1 Tax=Glutamicibacter protophormiae TaxID=37930 RepID=UPI002A840D29|nr:PEP/pyruvate-binding domain-containing protein [Glutamicibacter protophormiae]WPR63129.1 PEP/pyruvate-binding domain-containing protein [Glutamicibacter protophormiae]WPR66625.1 PEP/pyruvate-binding domain-containing protein [Glutamicibacter protophormiae]
MILPLSNAGHSCLAVVGGKAAGLGELIRLGENVPDGFVVTTAAYEASARTSAQTTTIDDRLAQQVLAAYQDLGSPMVAVRSSATAEDLPGASFAGQQETYLGVLGESQLLQAIQDCWASLESQRARAYRAQRSIDEESVSIAVVVQKMVDADFAGVMFTADPVTGDRRRTVIESNPGLGEAVVSGLVTTDRALLDAHGKIVERRAGQASTVIKLDAAGGTRQVRGENSPRLDEATLREIAEAGGRIRDGFGRPMDVEWAVADGDILILQARPMTALPPEPRNIGPLARKVAPMLYELLPQRPTILETEAWIDAGIAPLVAGMLHGIAGVRVDYSAWLKRENGVVTEFIPITPKPSAATPRKIFRALTQKPPTGSWREDPLYDKYLRDCQELNELHLADLSWKELAGIPNRATGSMQLVTELRVKYLRQAIPAGIKLILVLALTGKLSQFASLSVTANTETHRINDDLQRIAKLIAETPGAAQLLRDTVPEPTIQALRSQPHMQEIAERIDEFLSVYGHRESASLLLPRAATWADDPTPVFHLLSMLVDGAGAATADNDVLENLLAHRVLGSRWLEPRIKRWVEGLRGFISVREDTHFEITRTMPVLRAAVIEMGRRLHEASALADPEDIWFVNYDLLRCAPGVAALSGGQLAQIAAGRRRRHDELAGSPMISPATLYDLSPVPGALLHGTGSGGGRASGNVRIINSPEEFGSLLPGEVLVCPATNPSWTPLFSRAAAVVVNHGSAASHAAIVAREYRIPAVMGCANATTVLVNGQQVIVDGDRGLVLAPDHG